MTTPPAAHIPGPHTHHPPVFPTAFWAVLAWSAAALGLALGWLAGVVPMGGENVALGSLLAVAGPGVSIVVTAVLGAVGVAVALVLLRGALSALLEPLAWALVGVLLLIYVESSLLVWLGYSMVTPVLVWVEPALGPEYVAYTFSPELLQVLFFALGVGLWGWAGLVLRRQRRRACVRCGRGADWSTGTERALRWRALRTGRFAVWVAFVLALLYPALRVPWLFGYPMGMDEERFAELAADPVGMAIGVGLGSAGLVGAVLMLGLVQGWGVRLPFWMVGLAGRRVPVPLAVVPAALVSLALVGMGRGVFVQVWAMGEISAGLASHLVVFATMPVWAAALAVATAAYALRRRAECGVCGRGLPEAWPVAAAEPAGHGHRD